MKHQIYQIEYGGHPLRYMFYYPGTRWEFRGRAKPADGEDCDLMSSLDRIEIARALLPPDSRNEYVEYRSLIGLTAQALLRYNCCIFHCVCFVWRGYAWLLTAPSGVGKTTQYYNWCGAHPDEIQMISGDMPVLERRSDGSIWAHPTAWNGKEDIGSRLSAPVGGVVLLEQGIENVLSRPPVSELLMPIFRQFIVRPDTETEVCTLTGLLEQMFRVLPFWKLVNMGDVASTEMLRDAFSQRLSELTPSPNTAACHPEQRVLAQPERKCGYEI